jgi:predicted DCC family thiol-disulfide oxidoreductase YuxK
MKATGPPLPAGVGCQDSVVLFDGVCNLCNGMVQFVIRHDKAARLRLAALQSPAGQVLLQWWKKPLDDFDTMVFIECGRVYVKSTAILRITRFLEWPWPLASLALVIPVFLRDWCYDRVAGNRYLLFGRRETCMMPTPDLLQRFLQ